MEDGSDGWEAKYKALRESYEDLERQTVALSGDEYHITDQEITKKFRGIRDGIETWIDEIQPQDKALFKVAFRTNMRRGQGRIRLSDIGLPNSRYRWEENLGKLETCIHVILCMVISESLKDVFANRYPLGLTPEQRDFLDHSHHQASVQARDSLSQPDPAKYYRWLGETLSYMSTEHRFRRLSKDETKNAFHRLRSQLSKWLDPKVLMKYEDSLRVTILEPAVAIHRTIHCSGKKYGFQPYAYVENPISSETMKCDIIDVEPFTSSRKKDMKGVFGCFMPALTVDIAFGEREKLLLPAVLLGYKSDDLDPQNAGRPPLTALDTFGRDYEPYNDSRYSEPPSPSSQDTRSGSKTPKPESWLTKISGSFMGGASSAENKKGVVASPTGSPRRKSGSRSQSFPKAKNKKPSSNKSTSADTSEHEDRMAASTSYIQPTRPGQTHITRTYDYDGEEVQVFGEE